jgi:hypothetical protein
MKSEPNNINMLYYIINCNQQPTKLGLCGICINSFIVDEGAPIEKLSYNIEGRLCNE